MTVRDRLRGLSTGPTGRFGAANLGLWMSLQGRIRHASQGGSCHRRRRSTP
jgi:hypothetical protein